MKMFTIEFDCRLQTPTAETELVLRKTQQSQNATTSFMRKHVYGINA